MNGKLIVISGPSGVGKSTVVKKLMSQSPNLHFSVSNETNYFKVGMVRTRSG